MKILRFLAAIFTVLFAVPSVFAEAKKEINENYEYQNAHLAKLEEFYSEYTPADENSFCAFDLDEALNNGVKFNEVSFIATHNSYERQGCDAYKKVYSKLSALTFGIVSESRPEFESENLTDQFEAGIRSVELDVETKDENGNVSFVVSHKPGVEIRSTCYDFQKALTEIKMWSDHNPNHLPITIIIEPKKDVPFYSGLKNFTVGYAQKLDEVIRETLGDTLLTPADMMGDYASFKEMRKNDGWLTLKDTLGKVMVLLHDTTITEKYIALDKSIKTQAMFPMLRADDADRDCASFLLINKANDALKNSQKIIYDKKLIVRTRTDNFYTKEKDCDKDTAIESGANIISTDHPVFNSPEREYDYAVTFDGGYTVKLNTK